MLIDGAGRDLTDVEAALGRMVFRASTVEVTVRLAGQILATTARERDDLTGVPGGALLKLAGEIVARSADLSPGERAAFAAIVADAKPHLTSRNTYIHGGWAEPDGVLTAINHRKDGVQSRPLAVADLDTLSDELTGICNRVFDWLYPVLKRRNPGVFTDEAEPNDQP